MRNDPIVDFGQRLGDLEAESPASPNPPARVLRPDWLSDQITLGTRLGRSDTIKVEGRANSPAPAADGTTPDNWAFYLPFHFYKAWGIYIRTSGILSLARLAGTGRITTAGVTAAYSLLLEHERFHFAAEYATTRNEVLVPMALYRPYCIDVSAAEHEEAMANGRAVRKLEGVADPAFVKAMRVWMRTQPPGYRDFEKVMPPRFLDAERRAAWFMNKPAAVAARLMGHKLYPAEFLFRHVPFRIVPVRLIFDAPFPELRIVRPFPKGFGMKVEVHTGDHRPPHVHIEVPPGSFVTRYLWPELVPYPGDPKLGKKQRKALDEYVDLHGSAIGKKVSSIPWS